MYLFILFFKRNPEYNVLLKMADVFIPHSPFFTQRLCIVFMHCKCIIICLLANTETHSVFKPKWVSSSQFVLSGTSISSGMNCTLEKVLADAKSLVERLRNHDNAAEMLIEQTTSLNKRVEAMKQVGCYHQKAMLYLTVVWDFST